MEFCAMKILVLCRTLCLNFQHWKLLQQRCLIGKNVCLCWRCQNLLISSQSKIIKMTEIHNNINDTLCDELEIFHICSDESELQFAKIIGYIEDIIMKEEFLRLHNDFMEDHWKEFDDKAENKLIYTEIFENYTEIIEKFIQSELLKVMPDFNMENFEIMLQNKQSELDGEIFEILSTFNDFSAFKTMFLDYKAMKEGKTADFSQDFNIQKYTLNLESS